MNTAPTSTSLTASPASACAASRSRTASAIANLSASKDAEINGNTSGRVTNKGMEGLAISPTARPCSASCRARCSRTGRRWPQDNRIVKIDIATGNVSQFAFDNQIGTKTYNSSELALNDHQLLVLERDGKGLGDGSPTPRQPSSRSPRSDLSGATDVSNISGAANLAAVAIVGTFPRHQGHPERCRHQRSARSPGQTGGHRLGQDVVINGTTKHTFYLANDNVLSAVIPNGGSVAAPTTTSSLSRL